MKSHIIYLLIIVFSPVLLFAQNNYTWKEKKISVNSTVKLEESSTSVRYKLVGNGIELTIETLGGMEGISGLTGSLKSYAGSFGYSSVGVVEPIPALKNLEGARVSAKKVSNNILLCMFATKDYKQHFACEIVFADHMHLVAESVLNSLSYNDQVVLSENNNIVVAEKPGGDLSVGSAPPDFTLTDIGGNSFNLSGIQGKVVMLDFWGTWCKPCLKMVPELKELYNKYHNSGFEIISIANDNDQRKWEMVVTNKEMNWINVIDLNEDVTRLYKIKSFPTLMLIGKDGKLISMDIWKSDVEKYLEKVYGEPEEDNSDSNIQTMEPGIISEKPHVTNTHHSGSQIETKMWQLLASYSPEGYTILDEFYNAPSEYDGHTLSGDSDFTMWIDGDSEHDLVKSTNTVVHEMNHGYTGKYHLKLLKEAGKPVDGDYITFYLGNNESALVKQTDIFVTREINSIFPQSLISGRYDTYVYPSEEIMGSQQDGVYGLLDELNAYYWGTKTSFDFYEYYRTEYNTPDGMKDFFSGFYGTYYAYLEFKGYILVYMMYAKQKEEEIYNAIMKNKEFLYAFRRIDENWKDLIHQFNSLKKTVFAEQKSKGVDISEDDGFLFFGEEGFSMFSETYNKLNKELQKPEYNLIAQKMGLKSAGGPEL